MGQVGYIQKTGWNDFHKYHYVTESDLVAAIRPLLAKMGVIIIPSVILSDRIAEIQERGGTSVLTHVDVMYTVTDGKETFSFNMPGEGADRGDKGIYKAITGSMKYALYKLFEVETGDDPERENHEGSSVTISPSSAASVGKGGKSEDITPYQLQRISATMREKGIDRTELLAILSDVLGVDLVMPENEEDRGKAILIFLKSLSSADAGKIVAALDARPAPEV